MKWWRVKFDKKTGDILQHAEVEYSEQGSAYVCFVQAVDAAAACIKAKEWYEARRKYQLRYERGRVAKAKESGLCTGCCKAQPVIGETRCVACKKAAAKYRERRRSGRTRPKTPVEAQRENIKKLQKQWNVARGGSRAAVLRVVLGRLDTQGADALRAWLVSELTRIDTKFVDPKAPVVTNHQGINFIRDLDAAWSYLDGAEAAE